MGLDADDDGDDDINIADDEVLCNTIIYTSNNLFINFPHLQKILFFDWLLVNSTV